MDKLILKDVVVYPEEAFGNNIEYQKESNKLAKTWCLDSQNDFFKFH